MRVEVERAIISQLKNDQLNFQSVENMLKTTYIFKKKTI